MSISLFSSVVNRMKMRDVDNYIAREVVDYIQFRNIPLTYDNVKQALRVKKISHNAEALHVLEAITGENLVSDEQLEIFRQDGILLLSGGIRPPTLESFIQSKVKHRLWEL